MNPFTFEAEHFFQTYKRLPLDIDRGEGVYLYTKDGTRYLDMFAGIAVNALGHGHDGIIRAIEEQSRKYVHLSNYFVQKPQIALARLLLTSSGYDRVFFSNSGTEATEGAIKIARAFGSSRGKTEIVGFSNGFHGRTMGALSIMDRSKYRETFGPFLDDCRVESFNNPVGLRSVVSSHTAALVLEFIQGEGGVRTVTPEFIEAIESLRKEFGFLLIADEIQSGLGRTGKFFAFQHFGVKPDLVLVAKSLGGGLPLGAILGKSLVAELLQPGTHGSTFGGNPVACAAGLVVLTELIEHGIMNHAAAIGKMLMKELWRIQAAHSSLVAEVRGYGLMLGMELSVDAEPIAEALREKHILVNVTDKTVLRILPPLIINEHQVNKFVRALNEVLAAIDTARK